MADIVFNWSKLELNLFDQNYTHNYFHAAKADFTNFKKRSPENIWIVRRNDHNIWLLARLSTDIEQVKPSIKDRETEEHWIRFNPEKSIFLRNPKAIINKKSNGIPAVLDVMFGGKRTGRGVLSAKIIEPFELPYFKNVLKESETISYHDFCNEMTSKSFVFFTPYIKPSKSNSNKIYDESTLLEDIKKKEAELIPKKSSGDKKSLSEIEINENDDLSLPLTPSPSLPGESGRYQDDPEKRKRTELFAVKRACEHYSKLGFSIVEKGKPYDLLCTRDELIVHVEVKGTTGNGSVVILTKNEVKDARDDSWRSDLFIVKNIVLTADGDSWSPSGGDDVLYEAWVLDEEDLEASEFMYRVPIKP